MAPARFYGIPHLLIRDVSPRPDIPLFRYPQWGIRIHCEKLPNPEANLWGNLTHLPSNQPADLFRPRVPVPETSDTYIAVPQNFVRGLFGAYGMDLPTQFTKPVLQYLVGNYTIPSTIDPSTVSYLSEFWSTPLAFFISNPRTIAKITDGRGSFVLASHVILNATIDQGWMAMETFFLQLNTSRTPSGRFPVYATTSVILVPPNMVEVRIGYDAVVCLQRYEPWMIEAYNTSTGSSSALRIVEKGNDSTPLSPSGNIRGARIANTRYLNKTGKNLVFESAYYNSLALMKTANPDSGSFYGPTLAVGPAEPLRPLLTLTYSADCFFHRWHRVSGIHRTVSSPVRRHPRTG